MTVNTQNTQQCDREVDLTSPGIMTLTSQLRLAPSPRTSSPPQERKQWTGGAFGPNPIFTIKFTRYRNKEWINLTDHSAY